MSEPRRVAFSLGSNVGDRVAYLQQAVRGIETAPGVFAVKVSSVYETDPVGGPEQADFLNAVVRADSVLTPRELLALAHRCEREAGRARSARWGPRTLDVDVLAIDAVTSDDPELTLPHPHALERAFVLVPWCDVDGDFVVGSRLVREWQAHVGDDGVRKTDVVLTSGP